MIEEQRAKLTAAIRAFGSAITRGENSEAESSDLADTIIKLIETREKKRLLMGTPESRRRY